MMMKEEVKHIFDRSACLRKKQIQAYLEGNMISEEVYALEHHINACPLCSMAMDGMQLRKGSIETSAQLNAGFLNAHFEATPQQAGSGNGLYARNLKAKEAGSSKPVATGVKLAIGLAACIGILWFIQSLGKGKKVESTTTVAEERVNMEPPRLEEQEVIVEQPLTADMQPVEEQIIETQPAGEAPMTQAPAETKPAIATASEKQAATAPSFTAKPQPAPAAAVKPGATKPANAKPGTAKPLAATTAKPSTTIPGTMVKPMPMPTPAPAKEPEREQPKPVAQEQPEERTAPKAERQEPRPEPKPAAKKEEAEEMPSDPIAAGKALMDKRSYNQAIIKMRNEMRSNNKSRRQEAVLLVAKCYQQLGNNERAKELLSSVVDEGGPEKKAAKKMLKEVKKDSKEEEE